MFRDLDGITPSIYEDDGCAELTDAEKEWLLANEFEGEMNESVGRVVSARFGLSPDEEAFGGVYDRSGWNMLEFQGQVGGGRFHDGNVVLGLFEKLIYFQSRGFKGYSDALAKFAGNQGLVTFEGEGRMSAGFIVGYNLRDGKTYADVAAAMRQLKSGSWATIDGAAAQPQAEDGTRLEIDLGNVKKEQAWREVKPNEVVPTENAFLFDRSMMSPIKRRFVYSAHIESMNNDENLSYDDRVIADKPLSVKQIFKLFWKRLPSGFNVPSDMDKAHREYSKKMQDAKAASNGDASAFSAAMSSIPFPVMQQLWYGNPEDSIAIVPTKEICDKLTAKGQAAGYFENGDSTEIKFNRAASDKIWVRQVITGGVQESLGDAVKPFFNEGLKQAEFDFSSDIAQAKAVVDQLVPDHLDSVQMLASSGGSRFAVEAGEGKIDVAARYVMYDPADSDFESRHNATLERVRKQLPRGFSSEYVTANAAYPRRLQLKGTKLVVDVDEQRESSQEGVETWTEYDVVETLRITPSRLTEERRKAKSFFKSQVFGESRARESRARESRVCDVPDWAVDYIQRGDRSGLTINQKRMVDSWIQVVESAGVDASSIRFGSESDYSFNPQFGAPCDCVKCVIPAAGKKRLTV